MITKEQKQKYLQSRGVRCPFCESDQIEGDHIDVCAAGAYQPIYCLVCDRSWTDEYTLTDISELD